MSYQHYTQQSIIPGQITEHHGAYFKAEQKIKKVPCVCQCDCRLPFSNGCSGFCYRWDNGDGLVFKQVHENELGPDCEIIETEFAKFCRGNS